MPKHKITLSLSKDQFFNLVNAIAEVHLHVEDFLRETGEDDPQREDEIDREADLVDILKQLEDQEPTL
jgi:hypothetical protein